MEGGEGMCSWESSSRDEPNRGCMCSHNGCTRLLIPPCTLPVFSVKSCLQVFLFLSLCIAVTHIIFIFIFSHVRQAHTREFEGVKVSRQVASLHSSVLHTSPAIRNLLPILPIAFPPRSFLPCALRTSRCAQVCHTYDIWPSGCFASGVLSRSECQPPCSTWQPRGGRI